MNGVKTNKKLFEGKWVKMWMLNYPPVSEASREVANLTERKNLCTPELGVKEFVVLSICDKL